MLNENIFSEPLNVQGSLDHLVEPSAFNTNYEHNSSFRNQFVNLNEINLDVNQLVAQSLWANSTQDSQDSIDPLSVGQPDLIITGLNITSPIKAGTTVNFNYTLRNQGGVTANSIQTKYYLSNDSLLDGNDLELGDDHLSSLARTSSQIRTDTVNFDGSLNSGTYYFFVVTDSANTNVESNETNNTFVREIRVTKPDLVVDPESIIVPTSPVIAGQSIRVGYTARNQGDAGASSGTTKYYLSSDLTLDSSDSFIANDTVASLSAGASTIRTSTITLGSTIASGTYYLLTQIDSTNTSLESNEANNVSGKAFNILGSPDLIINTLSIPSSVAAGSSASVSYTVQNIGQSTAPSHITRFYLSSNTTYETTDLEIGSDSVVALAAGTSISKVKNLTISNTISDGNYYLITRSDTGNNVRESNETNNLFASPTTIEITKPDLEISQFTFNAPNNPTVGTTIGVNYTLTNRGKASARASITKYYLSSDELFDASDSYLGDDSVTSLAVGATLNRTDSFVLNTNLSSGTYYLLAIADESNLVAESNENNNLASQPITGSSNEQPDLVIAPIAGNLVANQGGNLNLSYTIENQGSINADPSTTKFYLSVNTTFDSSDVLLGTDSVTSLASGTTRTQSVTLPISSNFNTGTYYLFAQADSEGVVTEIDENNIIYQTLQITPPPQPDLLFDGLSIPNTVTQNGDLLVSYNIRNQGTSDASSTTTKFYLSSDATLDNSDVALGTDNLAALVSGATSNRNLTIGLNNIVPGTYYLLAQADSSGSLSESNENNNLISQIFEITEPPKPDLVINSLVAAPQVNKGSNLVVVYNILNQGLATAASSTTKFYLSTDTTFGNDIYLGSDSVASLASNETSPEDALLAISNSYNAGTYYLFALSDDGNVVVESNENNNLSYQTVVITDSGVPDLIINPLSVTVNGLNLSVSYTITNQGSSDAASSKTRFYLSSNNVLDATDTLLGTDTVSALTGQANSSRSIALTLANNLNAGTYQILAQADGDSAIAESNETNNIAFSAITLRSDLSISGFSVNNGTNQVEIVQGYGFVPRYTLNNTGNALASPSTTRYVVSADNIIGNADDYIPTFLANGGADAALNAGTSRVESNDFIALYDGLSPGIYNFYAIADSTNAVGESNETNNVARITLNFQHPPQPDLAVEKVNLPSSANVGGYINLSYTIRNLDLGYVGYSNIGFYLSTDNTIDASDINLGSHMATSSTPQGVPITRNRSLFLDPLSITPRTYNLIARIDPNSSIAESNENNNTLVKTITINPLLRPDLTVTNIPVTSFSTGIFSTIPYTITNNGAAVSRSRTTFYLSTDATLSTSSDILLGNHSIGEMGSFTQRSEAASLYLNPSAILNGTNNYYLIAVADFLDEIAESSENNNITTIPVTVVDAGTTRFSSSNGYGMVNASAAIERTLNLPSLPDVPNTQSWGADLIKAPEVWNAGYTGQGITVAVVDTGVDYNHPDLINNIWSNPNEIPNNGIDDDGNNFIDDVRGWDFVSNDNAPLDPDRHGTHVAGIIAASRNSFGVTGIAYDAKIMPLRVLGGGDQWGNVNNAIRYAVDNGARVINLSLGGNTLDQDGRLRESLQYASNRGVIVVMAAGNNSLASPLLPANHAINWGLAVGAVNSNGTMANYSNKAGGQPNLVYVTAPGSSSSTLPNNRYGVMNGTSMASPHVAGVVALMLSANPNLTDASVRQILTSTTVTTLLPANSTPTISSLETFELEDPFVFSLIDLYGQI